MGIFDALLGRTKPAQANLEHLFGLPGARISLEASEGLVPTGNAGVCFKPAVGQEFAATEKELTDLLQLGDDASPTDPSSPSTEPVTRLSQDVDEFGYRWVVISSTDFDLLVTRVHVVNSTLEEHGYGPQLLCSVFGFTKSTGDLTLATSSAKATTFLVYLYKRGTFYPFVPLGGEKRDNETELRLKLELTDDLSVESDLSRWFPIWKLPVD